MSRQRPQRIQKNKQTKPSKPSPKQGASRTRQSPINSNPNNQKQFYLDFKNQAQKLAYGSFQQHDVLFLLGPAGVGKSHLAIAFAINEVLAKRKKKIILTRPVVEAGENLGFLPGTFEEKLNPYIMPMFDCIERCVGKDNAQREIIDNALEIAPLAYMRGRSLSVNSIIPTPYGKKSMGEIKVGDLVFGSNGQPTKVLGVYPQGILKTYRVILTDGTEVVCSGDHLWPTMTLNEKRHNKGFTIKTTDQIRETVLNKHNQKIHRMMYVSNPVEFEPRNVSVDPYLLGCLLGDGCLRNTVTISTIDLELLEECKKRLPDNNEFVFKGKCDYRVKFNGNSELKNSLIKYGLFNLKSNKKFVPENYKMNSKEVRLEVLQGLLDTDGTIGTHRSGKCRIQYTSTSKQLAEDVMFLVRSLGGHAYCRLRKFSEKDSHEYEGHTIRHVHNAYVVDIMMELCPFKLSRKAVKHVNLPKPTKMIKDVVPCGEAECVCIAVEAQDHLFLANDFIVTHNTFNDSICIFDESQNATYTQIKLFLSRFGENSKVIVTGDPNQSDLRKQDQGLMKIVDKLEDLPGIGFVHFKSSGIIRHPLIESILGRLEEDDEEKFSESNHSSEESSQKDDEYYEDDDYDDEDYDDDDDDDDWE